MSPSTISGSGPVVAVDPADLGVELRADVRVPARDGVELSVNLFLPLAARAPVPVILSTDPYRKDDWSAGWDLSLAAYLASNGYAYARLDVRGTGSSGGVALDEYTEAETRDGHDTVEWLAAQPWCTGAVGMWGLSYGGFTSIQVAATRPPHLRAIVPIQATDDRYTDDVHYVGGTMTVSELAQYAVSQVAMNALPAAPGVWGPPDGTAWLERWRERLEATPVWLFEWARQQRDGPYWRRGSLRPAYGRIQAAILHITGWMDEYVDAAVRMQARCYNAVARRTIVGPWVHGLPDYAYPGPNIDWLREMVRWFDRFLKDERNGADLQPALTWFHRDPTPPERFPKRLAGEWRATDAWPPTEPRSTYLRLRAGSLDPDGLEVPRAAGRAGGPASTTFPHRPTAGIRAGSLCWGAGHPPNGLASDLRLEADAGPAWVSEPLGAPVDVLGVPIAHLFVSASARVAHLVARLGCVLPDGSIEQVSEGIFNITHANGHERPEPIADANAVYALELPLRVAGYRFPAGHRIHLSLASSHWPVIWPSPGAGEITIHHAPSAIASRLELPLAPAAGARPPAFSSDAAPLAEVGSEVSEPTRWEVVEDEAAGTATVRTHEASVATLPDGVSTLYVGETLEMTASNRDPGAGRFENACEYRLDRAGHLITVIADGGIDASPAAFEMTAHVKVDLDGEPFFERTWREQIPRDLL